jgi:hypothetical protein
MQTNNPDMIGFQNSLRKNSWQKPKPLFEMEKKSPFNEKKRLSSVETEIFNLTHPVLSNTGHILVGKAIEDGKSKEEIDAIREANKRPMVDFAKIAQEVYPGLVQRIKGEFHAFEQNPDASDDERGPREITHPMSMFKGKRIAPIDAAEHLEGHLPEISDEARNMAHEMFVDHLNKEHESQMRGQKAAEQYEAGQDLDDMQAHTLHRQGRTLKTEATLRTHPAEAYRDIPTNLRQTSREWATGRVMDALMDPNHPINADPANQDERDSLMRVLTDMGHFKHKQYDGGFDNTDLRDMGSSIGKEFTGVSASDRTKTGPGTQSANVQDLRRFVKFKDKRVYQKPYFGQSPIGHIEPTDE